MATPKVGEIVTFQQREYEIIHIDVTADKFPNIKKKNPDIMYNIVVRGKRGALKDGWIYKNGKIMLML